MNFFYPTLGALAILAGFLFVVGRQNRDLLRVRAYGEFLVRLLPLLTAGILILGLPFVMDLTIEGNALLVLLVYLGGAVVLTVIMARLVAPEERRAGNLFRSEEYEGAADIYAVSINRRPPPPLLLGTSREPRRLRHPRAVLRSRRYGHKARPEARHRLLQPRLRAVRPRRAPAAREDLRTSSGSTRTAALRRAAEEL